MKIIVQRQRKTVDGILGLMTLDDNPFGCFTIENLAHEIPAGFYDVKIDHSPHIGIDCPHIKVPSRDEAAGGDAGIRIHPANYPTQLLGCIAVGDRQENDSVDDSQATFAKLMFILKEQPSLQIEIRDIPAV